MRRVRAEELIGEKVRGTEDLRGEDDGYRGVEARKEMARSASSRGGMRVSEGLQYEGLRY